MVTLSEMVTLDGYFEWLLYQLKVTSFLVWSTVSRVAEESNLYTK